MDAPVIYAMREALHSSPKESKWGAYPPEISSRKLEISGLCALILGHLCPGHLKQCCTQNSERLLRTPGDEKEGSRQLQALTYE